MHIYLFYRSCFTAALNASCFTTQCPCSYSTFEHCSFSPHRVWPHNVSLKQIYFTLEFSVKTDNSVEEIYSNLHYLLLLACNTSVKILGLVICFYCICSGLHLVLTSVVSFSCIMGALRNPSAPIPHDSLHSSPFYLKGPRTAATEKPPETRGHPGCNDKSKNYPRAHKRRIKPPQALSFRYPWDSVSRSHQILCHPLHPQCTNYLFWSKTPLSII